MLSVTVVYIPVDQKTVQGQCVFSPNMTVDDALTQSGLRASHPEINGLPVGIFSTQVSLDTLVKAGDRIEIYRPLVLNPMEKRRQRAARPARK